MDNYNLIPFAAADDALSTLNPAETIALQQKLWALLSRRTALYTMGDSCSVRTELAQELLESIYFLLRIGMKDSGMSLKDFLSADESALFTHALTVAEKYIRRGKRLYKTVCLNAPSIRNYSMHDTIKGIGTFFRRYDYRFLAHQIPGDIDYQLAFPIPSEMRGIEYINEYLTRLIIENNFIACFENADEIALLNAHCSDYKGLLINLYSPIFTNALGLALLGQDVSRLNISPSEKSQMLELPAFKSREETEKCLRFATKALILALQVHSTAAKEYMLRTALSLAPRIIVAAKAKNLDGIFLSW